ncbi:MAG: hypothetical protein RIQ81_2420 [Pseudomonadota bacterium]
MLPNPVPSGALPPPTPEEIKSALAIKTVTIEWLAGDGSDRSYYRIRSPELQKPVVLMQLSGNDARALQAGRYDWLEVASILTVHGIRVPRLVKSMPDQAALVIEDYGNIMLETRAHEMLSQGEQARVEDLYREAGDVLVKFLEIKVPANIREERPVWTQRAFDLDRFEWELNFFCKKFLEPVARIKLSEDQSALMQQEIAQISRTLATLPQHFVHRDFHSRNIMVDDARLAVIDFQDARLGPAAYDAVSLFFDSYVPFPAESRRRMFAGFLDLVGSRLGPGLRLEIEQQWRAVLLQRQLKAIGSFGYLTIDKNKGNYLRYVKPALATLKSAGVSDPRWPFLSGELIEMIDNALGG